MDSCSHAHSTRADCNQPITIACTLWGRQWRGTTVRANCDNEAIVAAINSGYLQNSFLMHFLRCIFVLLVILENVEHCGGEPEQASTMATHK